MKHFLSVHDVNDVNALVKQAIEIKKNPFTNKTLGTNKTIGLIFLNPSLRTRLSTQKAAINLGMDVMVMNMGTEGWALETKNGVVMDGNTTEHIKEAAAVIGSYCDIIGIRSFPGLKDREEDYNENLLNYFIKYAHRPIVSLESATLHPFQSLADMMTIEELKDKERPKVVLTWAPHVKALPQSVPNSFAQWTNKINAEFVIAHPKGYDLDPKFVGKAKVTNDQDEAFRNADFIYAKNWSSYTDYGQILSKDPEWTVSQRKMNLTNNAKFMHCLPVRRNLIVTDEVIDSPNSVVIQEAANRVFSAQVVLKTILEGL